MIKKNSLSPLQKCNRLLHGMTLLEAAISIALLGIVLIPLTQWLHSENSLRQERLRETLRTTSLEALEAYLLTHQSLPCPTVQANGTENRDENGSCHSSFGYLPSSSLGIPARFGGWRYTVASLEHLGPPAEWMLVKPWMAQALPINLRDEILLKPVSPNSGLDDTALPALHLCHLEPESVYPTPNSRGCGSMNMLSPTGIAVILPPGQGAVFSANQERRHQFLISPSWDPENPIWISYERFRWLLRNH